MIKYLKLAPILIKACFVNFFKYLTKGDYVVVAMFTIVPALMGDALMVIVTGKWTGAVILLTTISFFFAFLGLVGLGAKRYEQWERETEEQRLSITMGNCEAGQTSIRT